MIQISNSLRRNTLTPALSAIVAAGFLVSAGTSQAAEPDARILAARAAASTADIEEISRIAADTADQIGTGAIRMNGTNIKTLAAGTADAIIAKTSANPPSPTDRNRLDNKADEIGEVAAFIQEGIANNPKYQKAKKARKATLTLMKGALVTAKKTAELFGTSVFRDVAGSVALTIHNDPGISDKLEAKILKFLRQESKAVAGKTNRKAIKTGLTEGALGDANANTKYEDGNIDALSLVQDPETDIRPA